MTPKEALKVFGEIQLEIPSHPHLRVCESVEDVKEAYKVIEQALTELEAIKRDVKRYFELDNKHGCTLREIDEWLNLERKLMKVGKEE